MSEVQDNPYSTMLNTLRADAADRAVAPWRTGILRGLSPPAVELGGRLVTSGVSINAALLGCSGPLSISGFTGSLSGTPNDMRITGGDLSGTGTLGAAVASGDEVVLLQSGDGQEYVILCKVV